LVELNDVFATLAEMTGKPLPADAAEDSFSFLPVLTGQPAVSPRRTFSVHHSIQGLFGLREGEWKYVPARGSGGFSVPKTIKPKPGEAISQLYRIGSDLSETANLAAKEPGAVQRMDAKLQAIQNGTRTRP
jgi:arylsulfatase A-like enzyme